MQWGRAADHLVLTGGSCHRRGGRAGRCYPENPDALAAAILALSTGMKDHSRWVIRPEYVGRNFDRNVLARRLDDALQRRSKSLVK